jgi:hypothetical protein
MLSFTVEVDGRPQSGLSSTLAWPSWKRLCHSQIRVSFTSTLPHHSSSIRNSISEGDLFSKTPCYVCMLFCSRHFKCKEPTMPRKICRHLLTAISMITEFALKWRYECCQLLTPKYYARYYSIKDYQIPGNFQDYCGYCHQQASFTKQSLYLSLSSEVEGYSVVKVFHTFYETYRFTITITGLAIGFCPNPNEFSPTFF